MANQYGAENMAKMKYRRNVSGAWRRMAANQ